MSEIPTILPAAQNVQLSPKFSFGEDVLDQILLTIISSILLSVLGIAFWGLNRGFDIMDEGFYLLMAAAPKDYVYVTAFHFLLSKLPNITGCLVTNLRLFQILSQLASSVVLTLGFWRLMSSVWLAPTKIQLWTSLLFTVLGSFLFQSTFPPSLSYNGLTSFLVYSSFGLLFAASTPQFNKTKKAQSLMLGAGFLCGFVLFTKFPACILATALSLLWFVVNPDKQRLSVFYLLGLAISFLVFLFLFETPSQFKEQVALTIKFLSLPTPHSATSMWKIYLDDIIITTSTIWNNLGATLFTPIVVMILSVCAFVRTKSPAVKSIFALMPLMSFIPALCLAKLDVWFYFYWYAVLYAALLLYLSMTLILASAKTFALSAKKVRPKKTFIIAIMLLFLLPLTCAAGTGNPILLQCSTCLSPVFLALSALSLMAFPNFYSSTYKLFLMTALSVLVLSRFIYGYIYHPYFLYVDLIDQTHEASILPNLKGIKIGQQAYVFLTSVFDILKRGDFRQGDPIVALYDMPGVVYAVGGRAPVVAWLFPSAEFKELRPTWFHDIGTREKGKLFILTSWELAPKTRFYLQQAGIDFPKSFNLIGTAQQKPYKDGYGSMDCGADDRYLGGEIRIYKRIGF